MTKHTSWVIVLTATTFLSAPATAKIQEITLDYLNTLTSPKIIWSETEGEYKAVFDGKTWYYAYTKPTGYETITKTPLNVELVNPPKEDTDYIGGAAINNPAETNYGEIDNKVFANNTASGSLTVTVEENRYLDMAGGAIFNQGHIGNITADFINNGVNSFQKSPPALVSANGGAIYNALDSTIGNITGNFVGNYISSD